MPDRALFFDLDGTLTDSDPLHLAAYAEVGLRYGVTVDEAMFRKYVSGRTNPEICADLFPHVDPAEHAEIGDDKEALFRSLIGTRLVPIAGLGEQLAAARARGWGLALVSNAPRPNVVDMLAALRLADAFDHIVIGSELARGKPDPMPYLTALDLFGLPAAAAVAFEDAEPGLRAAVGAGIATVGLTTTLSAATIGALGARLAIADYRDPRLAEFLDAVLGPARP